MYEIKVNLNNNKSNIVKSTDFNQNFVLIYISNDER